MCSCIKISSGWLIHQTCGFLTTRCPDYWTIIWEEKFYCLDRTGNVSCSAKRRSLSKEVALLNCVLIWFNMMCLHGDHQIVVKVASSCIHLWWLVVSQQHLNPHQGSHLVLFSFTSGWDQTGVCQAGGWGWGTCRTGCRTNLQYYSMWNPWTQQKALYQPSYHNINQPSRWITFTWAALCTSKSLMSIRYFSVFCFTIIGSV